MLRIETAFCYKAIKSVLTLDDGRFWLLCAIIGTPIYPLCYKVYVLGITVIFLTVLVTLAVINITKTCLALILAASTSTALANNLDLAEQIQSQTNAASAVSQQRIDASAEKTLSLKFEIEQLEDEVNNLQLYRQHLTALVASQNQELMSLDAQIKEVQSTRQGVVPLMYQMIAGLKQIVASDVPLKREQRQQRVTRLETMMARADVSEAEKYRRILKAYQIELDYGTKLGMYQGSIELNGESREAELVYLGRISLIARSLDGQQFLSWDRASSKWQAVSGSLSSELNQAFSLAAKKSTPSLLTVPASLMVTEAKK